MKKRLCLFLFLLLTSQASFLFAQTLLQATGSANTFSLTYPANFGIAIPPGTMFTFQSNQSITGTTTLNVNGTGAFTIKKNFNQNLSANDIKTNHFVTVIFDGTNWQMLSAQAVSGSSQWSNTGSDIYFGSGNVGIGTANPNANFQITSGSTEPQMIVLASGLNNAGLEMRSTDGTTNQYIDFTQGSSSEVGSGTPDFNFRLENSGTLFQIRHSSGQGISLNYTGKVGIGTSAPSTNLHVIGTARITSLSVAGPVFTTSAGDLYVSTTSGASLWTLNGTNIISTPSTNNLAIGTTTTGLNAGSTRYLTLASAIGYSNGTSSSLEMKGSTGSFDTQTSVIDFFNTNSPVPSTVNNARIQILSGKSGTTQGNGQIVFSTYNTSALTEIMRITHNSVGIGTNPSYAKFEVSGAVNNTGALFSTGARGVSIYGATDAVIGLNQYEGAASNLYSIGTNRTAEIRLDIAADAIKFNFHNGLAGASNTLLTMTNRMTLSASGDLRVGTGAPNARLDVQGNMQVGTSAGFAVNTMGNVISVNGLNAVFPSAQGGVNTFLRNDGAGNLTWVTGAGSQWTTNGSNIYFTTGSVAIGLTAPGYDLDVINTSSIVNDASIHGLARSTLVGPANWAYAIYGEGYGGNTGRIAGVYGLGVSTSTGYGVGVYGVAIITGSGSGVLTGVWGEGTATNTNDNYGIYGRAGGSSTNNYAVSATVTNSGGTSSNYGLYSLVSGAGTNNYGVFVTVAGTATNKYAGVFMGGGVGIGTITPQTPLDVRIPTLASSTGPMNPVFQVGSGDGTPLALRIGFQPNATASNRYTYIESFDGVPRNLILQPVNGNVGIGTTAPGFRFHVSETNNTLNGSTSYTAMTANTTGGSWSSAVNGVVTGLGSNTESYVGVWGTSLTNAGGSAIGVYGGGRANGGGGNAYGVRGDANYVTSGQNVGLYGSAYNSTGFNIGVYADLTSANGVNNYGFHGLVSGSGTISAGLFITVGGSALNRYGAIINGGALVVGTVPSSMTQITNTGFVLGDGHLRSVQTTAPTAVVSIAGAGTSATCTLNNATDVAGRINLTSGSTAWAAGVQCRITFNKAFAIPPIVILTPTSALALGGISTKQYYPVATTTYFDIVFGGAFSVASQLYSFNYIIIETQ